MPATVNLLNLGVEPYMGAHDLQLRLVAWRQADQIGDTLVLLEHTPVITLGRRADTSHILADKETLTRQGIAVHRIERGGDVTYHGPGQLVGYPILHLPSHNLGASDYMHRLEEVAIRVCADYGLQARRREGIIGVWIGDNKVCALGVRIRRGVTFHGLALNVDPDMGHWDHIIPCGITEGGVTSLAAELADAPPIEEVRSRAAAHFAALFGVTLVPVTLPTLEGQARAAGG